MHISEPFKHFQFLHYVFMSTVTFSVKTQSSVSLWGEEL